MDIWIEWGFIKCHLETKSNPRIGYINIIKNLWDEIQSELLFSAKNLWDQASWVEKKNRVVMETEHRIDKKQSNTDTVNNNSDKENCLVIPEHVITNNILITDDIVIETVENPLTDWESVENNVTKWIN